MNDSLKYQWRLLMHVMRADWASRLDMKVAAAVIDRYFPKYKTARVAVRFLEKATGEANLGRIRASLRTLEAHGVIAIRAKGAGTRPTEYAIHFDAAAVNSEETRGDELVPSEGTKMSPLRSARGDELVPKTDLHVADLQEGLHVGVTVAPASGGSASPGGSPPALRAVDGDASDAAFESAWLAYGKYGDKKKGRAAWKAAVKRGADPDAIRDRAASWLASAKPNTRRARFENWLNDERYDEADRHSGHEPAPARVARAMPAPARVARAMPAPARVATVMPASAWVAKAKAGWERKRPSKMRPSEALYSVEKAARGMDGNLSRMRAKRMGGSKSPDAPPTIEIDLHNMSWAQLLAAIPPGTRGEYGWPVGRSFVFDVQTRQFRVRRA